MILWSALTAMVIIDSHDQPWQPWSALAAMISLDSHDQHWQPWSALAAMISHNHNHPCQSGAFFQIKQSEKRKKDQMHCLPLLTDLLSLTNFYIKSDIFQNTPQSWQIFVLLLKENLPTRLFKNWPISSLYHWSTKDRWANTHHRGKYHCPADLIFDLFGFDQTSKAVANSTWA